MTQFKVEIRNWSAAQVRARLSIMKGVDILIRD